jgi:hypothetical protein
MKENEEIVAAISAVLNLYNRRPDINLKVKSIKRIHHGTPVWASAGRMARMDRRLNS